MGEWPFELDTPVQLPVNTNIQISQSYGRNGAFRHVSKVEMSC